VTTQQEAKGTAETRKMGLAGASAVGIFYKELCPYSLNSTQFNDGWNRFQNSLFDTMDL
jgi:hypothetical protein